MFKKIILILTGFAFPLFLTIYSAQNMQKQLTQKAQDFLQTNHPEITEHFEKDCIQALKYPYYYIRIDKLSPFSLPQISSYGSDDWIFGKWHLIYGFEAALSYYDEYKNPLLLQGNYLYFDYTTEENWNHQQIETKGNAYLNLDSFPELCQSYSSSPLGLFFLDDFLKMTGTFNGHEFIPVRIDKHEFIDSYHPTSQPDLQRICELEERNLNQWKTLYQTETPSSTETIYAYHPDGYFYEYTSFELDKDEITLPELLHQDIQNQSSTCILNLFESIQTFSYQREDGLIIAFALRYWPLQYAANRLIPAYLILLIINLFLFKFLKKSKAAQ